MGLDSPAEPTRAELLAIIAAQAETIAALKARIAELERRAGLDSGNSSKPPSSDGLKKPAKRSRVSSLRERTGKTSGGQKGHKGETLRQSDKPDVTIDHFPSICPGCGETLKKDMAGDYAAR